MALILVEYDERTGVLKGLPGISYTYANIGRERTQAILRQAASMVPVEQEKEALKKFQPQMCEWCRSTIQAREVQKGSVQIEDPAEQKIHWFHSNCFPKWKAEQDRKDRGY